MLADGVLTGPESRGRPFAHDHDTRARSESRAEKNRPCRKGTHMVSKYPGVTASKLTLTLFFQDSGTSMRWPSSR